MNKADIPAIKPPKTRQIKSPNMNLEETVKNLFVMEDLEQLLKMHADDLVEGKLMSSNQTTTK